MCCCLSYKDTILKANHSRINEVLNTSPAVAYPTKILFWKRITAACILQIFHYLLLLILQRYYFESESQLFWYILLQLAAVAYPTKILFWKRITAAKRQQKNAVRLLLILQRYYFESESQHVCNDVARFGSCCLSYKDTILKANHSTIYTNVILHTLLLILQRYYFESESQHWTRSGIECVCCCLSYKDTILKANHSYFGSCIGKS